MPDGSNLIVAGRTRHQIALADPTCKAVKTTLIDYDPAIHTDEWVHMTNAGEHIINRTATTEHFATYFTHNPITHARAIEQGLVPIDPRTGAPSAAYTKGRQLAEQHLAAKAEADTAAAKAAAAEAKTQAEKTLPGKTKWNTPSKKSKPLSDSETKQTLISVAALGLSKYKNDRFQYTHTLTQRKDGTEYTVATDGRRLTVISQPTYKPDTDATTQEWHSSKGEKTKENQQAPKWTQVLHSHFRGETTIDLSYYSFLGKGLKGPAKDKHIDSPLLNKGQYIVVNSTNRFLSLNPIYVRDAYKQIVDLGKKLGFSPIVKLQYNDAATPVMFTAEHSGIKWQYVLMPVLRNKEATPGDIILGEQPTIYSEQETPTGSFSIRVSRETIRKATANQLKSKERVELCTLPRVLSALGENAPGIYTRAETLLKLAHKHHLSDQEIEDAIKALDDPLLVIKESATSYIFYLPIEAKNKAGQLSPVMAALRMRRDDSSGHYLMSAYPLENTQKIEERIRRQDVVYSKYDKATLSNSNAPSPFKPDLVRLMVKHGFTDNVLTEEDIVNFKFLTQGFSDSSDSYPSQQETSVSSLSLRRSTERNATALLNERETTLLRVANYIKREADRTANVMGKDTELQRAGVAFAQANAIINALDTHIFPQEHITKNSEEYRRLRALRNYLSEYIRIAAKGKLPVRRTTKDGHITIKAAIRELLETQLPAARNAAAQASQNRRVAITSYREEWKREPTRSGVYGNAADDEAA